MVPVRSILDQFDQSAAVTAATAKAAGQWIGATEAHMGQQPHHEDHGYGNGEAGLMTNTMGSTDTMNSNAVRSSQPKVDRVISKAQKSSACVIC